MAEDNVIRRQAQWGIEESIKLMVVSYPGVVNVRRVGGARRRRDVTNGPGLATPATHLLLGSRLELFNRLTRLLSTFGVAQREIMYS